MSSPLWICLCLIGSASCLDVSTIHTQTVCNTETFNTSCPSGHVILMESALYGRMPGRCLSTNFSVGCTADVLDLADVECSGRKSCNIAIPNSKFGAVQTCRIDVVVHFEAKYRCVPAILPNKQLCLTGKTSLNASQGYIVFYPALRHTSCSLAVKVKPGQQVKVTVMDFTRSGGQGTKSCSLQVGFQEKGGPTSYLDGCTLLDHQRESLLYWSRDSQINITVLPRYNIGEAVLLHYQGTGCANLATPAHGHVERVKDTLVISCNQTREKWHLVCKDDSWVGNFNNCISGGLFLQEGEEDRLPLGLLVAIALGVLLGVFAGFLFLLLAFLCKQSLHRRPDIPTPPVPDSRGFHGNTYKMVDVQTTAPEESCYMCYHDYEGPSEYTRARLDVPATERSFDSGQIKTGSEGEEPSKTALSDVSVDCGCPGVTPGVTSVGYRGQTPQRGRGGEEQLYRFTAGSQGPVRVALPSVSVNAELKYS